MNKVVGILSMQRVCNYGSFLQAYALKNILKNNGAKDVYFIDIESGKLLLSSKKLFLTRVMNIFNILITGKLFSRIKDKHFIRILNRKFVTEYYPMLELEKNNPTHFDLVVIGSDEVFNCCQYTPWGYTKQLYGNINNVDKVISYAASFGHTRYEQLENFHITKEISYSLQHLSKISVRDLNSFNIIEKLTRQKPYIHLDPVLMYDFSKEIEQLEPVNLTNYVIIYTYQGRINDKTEIKKIKEFAQNKKIISIFSRYDWCDESIIPDTPFDVLNWFKNADCIITDTFHGTIFSIITRREFWTIIRNSNKEKISFLLKRFNLENRSINLKDRDFTFNDSKIDYEGVNRIINDERIKSYDYIKESLK